MRLRKHLGSTLRKESQDSSSVCHLIVSHGHFIDLLPAFLSEEASLAGNEKSMEANLDENADLFVKKYTGKAYQFPDYCAISGFTCEKRNGMLDSFKHVFDKSSGHVEIRNKN